MGTYYRYVNYTRKEFVSLSDLRNGGDKENAALYCGPALIYLLRWPYTCGDGYRGRWYSRPKSVSLYTGKITGKIAPVDRVQVNTNEDIRIVTDGEVDFFDMHEEDLFLNITPGLLQSLRENEPGFVEMFDYGKTRIHDVTIVTHEKRPTWTHTLLDKVSASCKCGWKVGPIFGDNRCETLTRIVSDHVTK